jgi:hypothetical protein
LEGSMFISSIFAAALDCCISSIWIEENINCFEQFYAWKLTKHAV